MINLCGNLQEENGSRRVSKIHQYQNSIYKKGLEGFLDAGTFLEYFPKKCKNEGKISHKNVIFFRKNFSSFCAFFF